MLGLTVTLNSSKNLWRLNLGNFHRKNIGSRARSVELIIMSLRSKTCRLYQINWRIKRWIWVKVEFLRREGREIDQLWLNLGGRRKLRLRGGIINMSIIHWIWGMGWVWIKFWRERYKRSERAEFRILLRAKVLSAKIIKIAFRTQGSNKRKRKRKKILKNLRAIRICRWGRKMFNLTTWKKADWNPVNKVFLLNKS